MNKENYKVTRDEVKMPLKELVTPNRSRVKIKDMADYSDIFYGAESVVLHFFKNFPELKDQDIIASYNALLHDFDSQEEGTLADEIGKSIKAQLIFRKRRKERPYSWGEIESCLFLLKKLAFQHKSSDGIGYLKWVRTFFEGKLPETPEEHLKYILEHEV